MRPASLEETHRIARFLFDEAELLDNRQYRDWLALFADDFTYQVPSRIHRQQQGLADDWAVDKELGGPADLPITMHNRLTLAASIERIMSGRTISENPPWFTERLITNIAADQGELAGTFAVRSKFVIQRYKGGREQMIFGHRQDRLDQAGDGFLIRHRRVILSSDSYRWTNFVFI